MRDRPCKPKRDLLNLLPSSSHPLMSIIAKEFTMKTCPKCKQTKPKSEFGISKRDKDGLKCYCKSCSVKATQDSVARSIGIKVPYGPDTRKRPPDIAGKRWCSSCKVYLPLNLFGRDHLSKDGISQKCKKCNIKTSVERIANEMATNKIAFIHKRRMTRMTQLYHITETEFQNLMNKQQGCCKICGKDFSELKRRANIDHDHKTSKVRGLLCDKCNVLLGRVKDDQKYLHNAAAYLKEYAC